MLGLDKSDASGPCGTNESWQIDSANDRAWEHKVFPQKSVKLCQIPVNCCTKCTKLANIDIHWLKQLYIINNCTILYNIVQRPVLDGSAVTLVGHNGIPSLAAHGSTRKRGCLSNRSNMFKMNQNGSDFNICKFKCQNMSDHSIFSQSIRSCLLGFLPKMRTLSISELRTRMNMHEHAWTCNTLVNIITSERIRLSMAILVSNCFKRLCTYSLRTPDGVIMVIKCNKIRRVYTRHSAWRGLWPHVELVVPIYDSPFEVLFHCEFDWFEIDTQCANVTQAYIAALAAHISGCPRSKVRYPSLSCRSGNWRAQPCTNHAQTTTTVVRQYV